MLTRRRDDDPFGRVPLLLILSLRGLVLPGSGAPVPLHPVVRVGLPVALGVLLVVVLLALLLLAGVAADAGGVVPGHGGEALALDRHVVAAVAVGVAAVAGGRLVGGTALSPLQAVAVVEVMVCLLMVRPRWIVGLLLGVDGGPALIGKLFFVCIENFV